MTKKEQIIQFVKKGCRNKDIAEIVGASERYITQVRSEMRRRLRRKK